MFTDVLSDGWSKTGCQLSPYAATSITTIPTLVSSRHTVVSSLCRRTDRSSSFSSQMTENRLRKLEVWTMKWLRNASMRFGPIGSTWICKMHKILLAHNRSKLQCSFNLSIFKLCSWFCKAKVCSFWSIMVPFFSQKALCIFSGPQLHCVLKTIHLTVGHNFGKCRLIYKFFHWQIPKESLCNYIRAFHLTLIVLLLATLPCETWESQLMPISMAYCTWKLRIHLARYKATLTAQVWIPGL